MACVSKIGSLYEMVTKNVIVSTTNTIFGINPRAWIALPCEGLILLKIRQVVPTAGTRRTGQDLYGRSRHRADRPNRRRAATGAAPGYPYRADMS